MRLPEFLRRYHTCTSCGKERHRSRMMRWGYGYVCLNEELCFSRYAWLQRMKQSDVV